MAFVAVDSRLAAAVANLWKAEVTAKLCHYTDCVSNVWS